MARIPEEEIEGIKREVRLEAVGGGVGDRAPAARAGEFGWAVPVPS